MNAGSGLPSRATPGRVAEIQRQVRPTFAWVGAFMLAAAVAGALPHDTARWLPLHLALAGGLILAVSGATQFLAVTWGAAAPPPRRRARMQRALVVGGVVLVAFGRERSIDAITAVGGSAVALGLALLAMLLVSIRRTAVQARVRPAVSAYLAGIGCGVTGVVLGAVLGGGGGGGGGGQWYARLRDVHEALNLLGLAGFVVAGTLPFFVATQAKTKMSASATIRAQFIAQGAIAAGLATAVTGLSGSWTVPATAGFAVYGAALVYLVTLLPRLGRRQFRWAGPRLLQSLTAIGWWIAAIALATQHAAVSRSPFSGAVVPALVIGGYVQLIVASLSYLGPVLVGGGHERLAVSFRLTRSWVGLIAGNVAAVAACARTTRAVYIIAVAIWAFDAGVRGALLIVVRLHVVGAQ